MNDIHGKLHSKIFVDGGNADETKQAKEMLGFLDGQTTNPSLAVKNPEVVKRIESGEKLTNDEALELYRGLIQKIAKITSGPVSIQVFGNAETSAEDMLKQARSYLTWIPNGFVKFPLISAGLEAVETFCQEGPVNMTLAFSQNQAAAVHVATRKATHPVFISPFVGRLDDLGQNGMDVVVNMLKMYQKGPSRSQVNVLTASVRSVDHLMYALHLKSPAITNPFKIIKSWTEQGMTLPENDYIYDAGDLKSIPYEDISLDRDWREYNIQHDLTDSGLAKFWKDWMSLQE